MGLELRSLKLCQSCVKILEEFERLFHEIEESGGDKSEFLRRMFELSSNSSMKQNRVQENLDELDDL